MSSTETKRERKRLARTLLKDAYRSVSSMSTMDSDEIWLLKDLPPVFKVDGVVQVRIAEIHKQRKQRAHYLRHLHLARAFLKGVPYAAVEQCPALTNSGWLAPDAEYIAEIINGQCALAESVTPLETSEWLCAHCLYQDYLLTRIWVLTQRALKRQATCEAAAAAVAA